MTKTYNINHTIACYQANIKPYKCNDMYHILNIVCRMQNKGIWDSAMRSLELQDKLEELQLEEDLKNA